MSPEHVSPGATAQLKALEVSRPLSVVVISPNGALSAHRISGPIMVGRDAPCELVLDDTATSRRHARLTPYAHGIEVTDLDSSNGTFVDGHRALRTIARAGSVIRIGSFALVVAAFDEAWQPDVDGPLVGGPALAAVRRAIEVVGPTPMSVMIVGERGTGRQLVARLLGAQVVIDCTAPIDPAALEGTVLLDRIDEAPEQEELARLVDERRDVRFIGAASAPLDSALYAKLADVEIVLPPLRNRREDIPALAKLFLGGREVTFSADAMEALLLHAWPQNIRELERVVRALALRDTVELCDLPLQIQRKRASSGDAMRDRVVEALEAHQGNVRRVAVALRMARGHVYRLLKRFDLEPSSFRSRAGSGGVR